MSEAGEEVGGRGWRGLVVGMLAALALGGAGFYAAWSGFVAPPGRDMLFSGQPGAGTRMAYVAIDPLTVSLSPASPHRLLRIHVELEVPQRSVSEVTRLVPRIVDVMNGFLRAVDSREMEEPAALVRLRSQLLRRVRIVAGEDAVNDLLIREFLLH